MTERAPTIDLILVAIDPPSLRELKTWPWPRNYYAEVIDRLAAAGARRIAFDIDFSSPSTPVADSRLEMALNAASPKVILPAFTQIHTTSSGYTLIETQPLPKFKRHAELASVNVQPESDGLVRRISAFSYHAENPLPSLSVLLAGRPVVSTRHFYIDFGIDPNLIPRISFSDVLAGRFDPEIFRGKLVIIGATAVELHDQYSVPVFRSMSGVFIHILAYQSLISNRALQRTNAVFILVIVFLLAGLLGPRFSNWSWKRGLVISIGIVVSLEIMALGTQAFFPVLVDTTPAILVLILLFTSGLIGRIDKQSLRLLLQGVKLNRTDLLMRSIVDNSFDGVFTVRDDGRINTANAAISRIFDYSDGELIDRHVSLLLPELAPAKGDLAAIIQAGHGHRELSGLRSDGSTISVEVAASEIRPDEERQFIAIVRDITERKAHEKELERLALYDALTGLPNRTLLLDRLNQALSESARRKREPFAVLLLDLDRFKEINDTLGHSVGDTVLIEVAKRFLRPLRDSDTIARLGGDEFLILLPAVTDLERARTVSERVLRSIMEPFHVGEASLEISASVGIALYPDHAEDAGGLLQCADVAMYLAKKSQTRITVYDREKDFHSLRQLTLTNELRRAIDDDQLALYYQPKIDLKAQLISGAEALIRWHHPEYGFIVPDEFIGNAERTGLIQALTRWVFTTAIKQLVDWQSTGLDIGISVNISAKNLQEEDLPNLLRKLLRDQGVDPQYFTLEITENAIMSDPGRALAVMQDFVDIGVSLSIDDFGTGHSSLLYLKNLPVNELKIDKSFVNQMIENEKDFMIVRSTIELAHDLGLRTVAEGVETDEQRELLRELGTDYGQGYFFSRPQPIEEFMRWLDESPLRPSVADDEHVSQIANKYVE